MVQKYQKFEEISKNVVFLMILMIPRQMQRGISDFE